MGLLVQCTLVGHAKVLAPVKRRTRFGEAELVAGMCRLGVHLQEFGPGVCGLHV